MPAPYATPAPSIPVGPVRLGDESLTARLALDCEMVGVGFSKRSALARVVVINFDEVVVYSCFVRPDQRITDYRTFVSGVKPEHMKHALPMKQVISEVAQICRDRMLIGHAINNDLKVCLSIIGTPSNIFLCTRARSASLWTDPDGGAPWPSIRPSTSPHNPTPRFHVLQVLLLTRHPRHMIRDTAAYEPFKKLVGEQLRPQKLKTLAEKHLGWAIQTGEHSPCEDAVAALRLYKQHMHTWERAPAQERAPAIPVKPPSASKAKSGRRSGGERSEGKSAELKHAGGIKKKKKIKRGCGGGRGF